MSLAEDLRILDLLEQQTDKTLKTPVLSVLSGPSLRHPQILGPACADYVANARRRAESAFSPDAMEDEAEVMIHGKVI
jgi:hypothetical protein